jgi:hypothetical protein
MGLRSARPFSWSLAPQVQGRKIRERRLSDSYAYREPTAGAVSHLSAVPDPMWITGHQSSVTPQWLPTRWAGFGKYLATTRE